MVTETEFSMPNNLLQSPTQIGNVNRIYTENGKLILAKDSEVLASMTISELVNAERQINGIRIEDEKLLLTFDGEVITYISLEEIRAAMGI